MTQWGGGPNDRSRSAPIGPADDRLVLHPHPPQHDRERLLREDPALEVLLRVEEPLEDEAGLDALAPSPRRTRAEGACAGPRAGCGGCAGRRPGGATRSPGERDGPPELVVVEPALARRRRRDGGAVDHAGAYPARGRPAPAGRCGSSLSSGRPGRPAPPSTRSPSRGSPSRPPRTPSRRPRRSSPWRPRGPLTSVGDGGRGVSLEVCQCPRP